MSRLLALDQASITTGYSIFIDGKLEKWGHFTAKGEIGDRLVQIRDFVSQTIQDYEIDQVVFEDIQFQDKVQNNIQTFKVLAEVFGIIYELVTELNIPNQAVLAGTWKSTLGIKGKNRVEQKRNAQEFVQNTYNIKCSQDEADAICIGTHILAKEGIIQKPKNKTSFMEDVFDWS